MDSYEADLDRIEAQRPTDMSHDEVSGGVPLLPMNIHCSQRGGDGATLPTGDTEPLPEFLINLRLSKIFALPGEVVHMTPEIFSGISYGSKYLLEELKSNGTSIACLKSDEGDSILHLAATWGHLELVKEIVSEFPCLLLEPNSSGKTPLHVAAHGGHTAVVEAFIALVTFASARLSKEESERLNPYVLKDEDGNTALYYAFKGHHMGMAACLLSANKDAAFLGNNEGISSLFMTVETGVVLFLKSVLKTTSKQDLERKKSNLDSKLQGIKYLAHAALQAKSLDVLDYLLDEYPSLMDERDSEGRTCLSYGACIGYYEGVCNLLDRSTKGVYVCDQDGSFPIHTAAKKGHQNIIEEFIKRCPDSKHLLNKLGQNVLHVAAKNGEHLWMKNKVMKHLGAGKNGEHLWRKNKVMKHLESGKNGEHLWMNNKDMEHLKAWQDVDGNTPLHLAVINWNYDTITWLASSSKILRLRNKSGLRAWEIAELEMKPYYIFEERWTLALLLYIIHSRGFESVDSLTRPAEPVDPKNSREYVNTLLVVAALVATVTFAAGFTIPGGFNSYDKEPDLGRATLATDPTLCIFLLLDILAMQSSVATIGILIWTQLGDPALIRSSLHVALLLLLLSLLCMPLAFLFGVITAVGHVKWLLVVICIISGLFFFLAIFVFGPHVMLQRSYVSPKYTGYFLVTFMQYKDTFEFFVNLVKLLFCWSF